MTCTKNHSHLHVGPDVHVQAKGSLPKETSQRITYKPKGPGRCCDPLSGAIVLGDPSRSIFAVANESGGERGNTRNYTAQAHPTTPPGSRLPAVTMHRPTPAAAASTASRSGGCSRLPRYSPWPS